MSSAKRIILILISLFILQCSQNSPEIASMKTMHEQIKKLACVELTADLSQLPKSEQSTLHLMVEASQIIDQLFLIQVSEQNPVILQQLQEDTIPDNIVYLDYFNIMFGPWDRLNEDHPFLSVNEKPEGAGYYPSDMTKEEFQEWIKAHPEDQKSFENEFTMIRRDDNKLMAIPYSIFFEEKILKLARILDEAAETTKDKTLSQYLKSRAEGLRTDDYYQSDMDWMDLAGDLEVVIGPYEVYEDNLFGYKAAFESFICVVDHQVSKQQKEIGKYLTEMEKHLPIPEEYMNFNRGASSPIKVVDLAYSSGDTKAGIQTTAFNLPNDERVRQAKGSKKVMLKNVMHAKFDKCWIPIVETVLAPAALEKVSFNGYFYHVLLHEVSHGLGPGIIEKDGKTTSVNKELKELYSVIEECKADVLGVYMTQFLIDQGVLPNELENSLYASNLGGMFRSIRFGIEEAHGGGVAIQLNYYLDSGAFVVNEDGRFDVNESKMKETVKQLAHDVLMIEAEGDYEAAQAFVNKYRILKPEVEAALDKLKDVPIDIRPIYPVENLI